MLTETATTAGLSGSTILISSDPCDLEMAVTLKQAGARVLTWPPLEIVEPEDFAALDQAIQDLFGYDWLIFRSVTSVEFFLRRFDSLSHEVSELDGLRVCAGDDATRQELERQQVHVDLVPEAPAPTRVMAALEMYVGGREALSGLNFLLPRAAISRDQLPRALEDAGARVDVVPTYRTSSNNSELIQLGVLLEGGGIDCIVFGSPESVRTFSNLFDSEDLSRLLRDVAVACLDPTTTRAVAEFGLREHIVPRKNGAAATVSELLAYLGAARH
jgi:uroporphyrinogen III methyltransferase/synthase